MATTGMGFGTHVCDKLGLNPDEVQRIIIDIPHNGAVRIYIQRFGNDKELLGIDFDVWLSSDNIVELG